MASGTEPRPLVCEIITPTLLDTEHFQLVDSNIALIGNLLSGTVILKCISNINAIGSNILNINKKPYSDYAMILAIIQSSQWSYTPTVINMYFRQSNGNILTDNITISNGNFLSLYFSLAVK